MEDELRSGFGNFGIPKPKQLLKHPNTQKSFEDFFWLN
jgi:hypothetical protein